jgi:predicted Zn-dependent protease
MGLQADNFVTTHTTVNSGKIWRGILTVALCLYGLSIAEAASDNFRARGAGEQTAEEKTKQAVSDVEAELKFGQNIAARILARNPMITNQSLIEYVNLVGNSVALHAGRPELTYRFAVVNSRDINAYAAPGGYIFITKPAIDLMQDESELAGALAHEIAHVTRKHIVKALKIKGSESGAQSGLTRFLGGVGDAGRVAFSQTINKAVEILFQKGLPQEDELDADKTGTIYLATTGYDPTALRRFLRRVNASKGVNLKIINSTHPPFKLRITTLAKQLKSMGVINSKLPKVRARFIERAR